MKRTMRKKRPVKIDIPDGELVALQLKASIAKEECAAAQEMAQQLIEMYYRALSLQGTSTRVHVNSTYYSLKGLAAKYASVAAVREQVVQTLAGRNWSLKFDDKFSHSCWLEPGLRSAG